MEPSDLPGTHPHKTYDVRVTIVGRCIAALIEAQSEAEEAHEQSLHPN